MKKRKVRTLPNGRYANLGCTENGQYFADIFEIVEGIRFAESAILCRTAEEAKLHCQKHGILYDNMFLQQNNKPRKP